MKKLLYAVAALLVLGACQRERELTTRIYERAESHELAPGARDSISLDISIEYPVGGVKQAVLDSMASQIISQAAAPADSNGAKAVLVPVTIQQVEEDIEKAVDDYIVSTVDNYRQETLPVYEKAKGTRAEEAWPMSWEDIVSGYFVGRYKKLASYQVYSYSYTGGAHGSGGTYCMNLSLKDGHAVTEDEFFVPGSKEKLCTLLSSHLKDQMESEEDYEMLFVKDIEPNGNFYVSVDGVSYVYGEYEIGPYSLGEVVVTVPWNEVREIVAREYR